METLFTLKLSSVDHIVLPYSVICFVFILNEIGPTRPLAGRLVVAVVVKTSALNKSERELVDGRQAGPQPGERRLILKTK